MGKSKPKIDPELRSLEEWAEEIIKLAKQGGVEHNYFFITTFERYREQLKLMEQLRESFEKDGLLISKEYVKGRVNLCAHPAIAEFNKTAQAANTTVSTLMKIITTMRGESEQEDDPLINFIMRADKK